MKYQSLIELLDRKETPSSSTRIDEHYRNSTAKIVFEEGVGSAFLLTKDGYFVTNEHVLNNERKSGHLEFNGISRKFHIENLLLEIKSTDLSLGKISTYGENMPKNIFDLNHKAESIIPESNILTFGFNGDSPQASYGSIDFPNMSEDLLSHLNMENGEIGKMPSIWNQIPSSCYAEKGWSGGPVMDYDSGSFLGITVIGGGPVKYRGKNIGHSLIHASHVKELISSFLKK